jgi:tripeptide aminopeptidase
MELLFTPKEEVGLLGADAFDESRLAARLGYVYDHCGAIGEIIVGAPYTAKLDVRFHGRRRPRGMYPEDGRSAIAAAARAIADLRLGRLDEETSANVGRIEGGTARNVVPEWCGFAAEARSHDQRKLADLIREIVETVTFAASLEECEVETEISSVSPGYRFRRDDVAVRIAAAALAQVRLEPSYIFAGGGADANVFNQRGLQCVNLANGMTDIHTPDERIAVARPRADGRRDARPLERGCHRRCRLACGAAASRRSGSGTTGWCGSRSTAWPVWPTRPLPVRSRWTTRCS